MTSWGSPLEDSVSWSFYLFACHISGIVARTHISLMGNSVGLALLWSLCPLEKQNCFLSATVSPVQKELIDLARLSHRTTSLKVWCRQEKAPLLQHIIYLLHFMRVRTASLLSMHCVLHFCWGLIQLWVHRAILQEGVYITNDSIPP